MKSIFEPEDLPTYPPKPTPEPEVNTKAATPVENRIVEVEQRYGPHGPEMTAYLEIEWMVYNIGHSQWALEQMLLWLGELWRKLSDDERKWLNERKWDAKFVDVLYTGENREESCGE